MASNLLDNLDGEVREGLLCPICFNDFHTIEQLQDHFSVAHISEEPDVLHIFKEFIGKAKKKLLKQDDENSYSHSELEDSVSFNQCNTEYTREPQQLGVMSRHTDYFRKIRDTRVDQYVIETNKLLIRLDKLIKDAPLDPDKRKAQEKNIVHWIPDADVRLCPGCARSFNLSRRKHHCRLCGAIMCNNCSRFLDFPSAKKLTYPCMSWETPVTSNSYSKSLQRRGSTSSILSLVSQTGEPHIRVCKDCMTLLNRRDQQVERQKGKSVIAQMYEKLKEDIEEAKKLIPIYCKKADSINAGETRYNLKDAQDLHVRLKKLAESIDLISRKIATLDTQSESAPNPKVLQLQGCIRLSASNFLREQMLNLPTLPSSENLTKLQEAHRQKVQLRIQQEKQAALEAQQRSQQKTHKRELSSHSTVSTSPKESIQETISTETGWIANTSDQNVSASDDPMVQQMNIIRNYIKQARMDQKYDEVQMLEANLKELQLEYMRQQDKK
ncbi:rabenosyn-5-like [Centruroides sculpturatus]|uniref:rabenosyn-5-like n=1 Tax=Centruroides sculpturatus TaxID=218467 RepID=UPI000C6EA889|nr:rabenosyn-5-like [Centruroides sculpturatus]